MAAKAKKHNGRAITVALRDADLWITTDGVEWTQMLPLSQNFFMVKNDNTGSVDFYGRNSFKEMLGFSDGDHSHGYDDGTLTLGEAIGQILQEPQPMCHRQLGWGHSKLM